MNSAVISGNLTADPIVSASQSGTTITKFTVAVNSRGGDEEKTSFIRTVAFGKLADVCGQYLNKGRKVIVRGHIQTGSYTNKEGQKVYTTDLIADEIDFLSSGDRKPEQTAMDGIPGFQKISDKDVPF